MFISYKNTTKQLLTIAETEWFCRATTKSLDSDKYWIWLATITDEDGEITYPSEDFTIVECTDEDVGQRLNQLSTYIQRSNPLGQLKVYNIKWSDSKVNCEEVLNNDGESQSPKVYVKSHFKGDDTAKDKRILDDEWTQIRTERTRLLGDTDHHALSDQTLSDDMKTYRKSLRDLPSAQSSKTKYSDITWPTKP